MSEITTEIWKPIKGYEGLYEVSNFGRVKSLGKFNAWANGQTRFIPREKLMSLNLKKSGYVNVTLQTNKIPKTYRVHRLVAEAFIPKTEGKEVVNHKDYNRSNNCVDNLEWATTKENYNYSMCNMPKTRKARKNKSVPGQLYISFHKGKQKYEVNFKNKYYGDFKTLEEAIKARDTVVEDYEKHSSGRN